MAKSSTERFTRKHLLIRVGPHPHALPSPFDELRATLSLVEGSLTLRILIASIICLVFIFIELLSAVRTRTHRGRSSAAEFRRATSSSVFALGCRRCIPWAPR